MRETPSGLPENIRIRYSKGFSEQKKQYVESEVWEDLSTEIDLEKGPELKNEREKTEWQKKAIQDASREIRLYFKEELDSDVPEIDIDKVHILKPYDFWKVCKGLKRDIPEGSEMVGSGFKDHIFLSTAYERQEAPQVRFIKTLIHEALHQRVFKKMAEVDVHGMKVVGPEREGLTVLQKGKYSFRWDFQAIDEGLTEMVSKQIFHRLVKANPKYEDAVDELFASADEKIDRDELFSMWGANMYDVRDCKITPTEGGDSKYEWKIGGTYLDEQFLIRDMATDISRADPEKYPSSDDALKLFLNAQYRGELLPLAKAIDKRFGKGLFYYWELSRKYLTKKDLIQ